MSGKLDQSLDDILKTRRSNAGGRGGRGRSARRATNPARANVAAPAPVGGVAKKTRGPKPNARGGPAPTAPAATRGGGESKIIVSGLPSDVNEQQIKDYFVNTIGPVKRVLLTYGPNGQSRGVATIFFSNSGSAAQAATQLNGVKVDNRPMKIEVIVNAAQAVQAAPIKALGDRIAKPKPAAKAQPKSAGTGATTAEGAGRGRNKRKGKSGKPKTKTAEELDAEMVDYFAPEATGATGATGDANAAAPSGAAPAAAAQGGEAMVEDEIM